MELQEDRNLMTKPPNKPSVSVEPRNRGEWRSWLNRNHQTSTGVWLVIPKKDSGKPGVTLDEAVEEAVCFGWIDSRQNPIDQTSYKLYFSPRKPGSLWSTSNKERVEKLTRQGLMSPAGLAKVDAAKKDGSWNTLDYVEALKLPTDLAQALEMQPTATEGFEQFTSSVKKQVLWWIQSAKTQRTRAKRIARTIEAAKAKKKSPFTE
jgi:uncharacterized protein YdeI (YjbR/CyaY-like superfamily)